MNRPTDAQYTRSTNLAIVMAGLVLAACFLEIYWRTA